jgi:hypothetical protein
LRMQMQRNLWEVRQVAKKITVRKRFRQRVPIAV